MRLLLWTTCILLLGTMAFVLHDLKNTCPNDDDNNSGNGNENFDTQTQHASLTKKHMKTKKNTLLFLMGDSIMENSLYVPEKYTTYNQLKKYAPHSWKIYNAARDNAYLHDIYTQLEKIKKADIPITANTQLWICLSIGGNNLIKEKYNLEPLFKEYKKVVEKIKATYPSAQLVLCNIYYPFAQYYVPFYSQITQWNELQSSLSSALAHTQVVSLSTICTDEKDFSHEIEPSAQGSRKIVQKIVEIIKQSTNKQ